jgi:hypothetical protein
MDNSADLVDSGRQWTYIQSEKESSEVDRSTLFEKDKVIRDSRIVVNKLTDAGPTGVDTTAWIRCGK